MNKIVTLLLALLFIMPIGFSAITTIEYSCFDANTQLINTTIEAGTGTLDYSPCSFGCDATTKSCIDASTEFQFGALFLIALGLAMFGSLKLVTLFSDKKSYLKTLFLFFTILLMVGILFSVGITGQSYANSYIASSSSLSFKIGIGLAWILIFLFCMLMLDMIIGIIEGYSDRNKRKVM